MGDDTELMELLSQLQQDVGKAAYLRGVDDDRLTAEALWELGVQRSRQGTKVESLKSIVSTALEINRHYCDQYYDGAPKETKY